jgi:hypothetical protein
MSTPAVHFVLYDNRSGSTLMSAMLNRHRGVSVSHECDYVFRILEHPRDVATRDDARSMLASLRTSSRIGELGVDLDRVVEVLPETGLVERGDVIRAITTLYFSTRDPAAEAWVVKGPRMHFHADALAALWPETRFIHVVRDGRAVFHSKARSWSSAGMIMDDNLVHAARTWRRKLILAERQTARLLTVRYEDLTANPETEMARLLDGLGIHGRGRELAKSQAEWAEQIAGSHKHVHTNVARRPKAELAGAWREGLEPDDVLLYEMLAGKSLVANGYPLYELPGAGLSRKSRALVRYARYTAALAARRTRHLLLAAGSRSLGRVIRRKASEFLSR